MTGDRSRRRTVRVFCAGLWLTTSAISVLAQPTPPKKLADIRIAAGDAVITAELVDHASARDLLRRLPMTVRMTRSGEREYHGRLDMPISVDGPKQTQFDNGDLGYWAPGGYLAIFLDNTVKPDIVDLIVLGRVTSDLAAIRRMGASVDMRIERAGERP